jgi:hypothetical protein
LTANAVYIHLASLGFINGISLWSFILAGHSSSLSSSSSSSYSISLTKSKNSCVIHLPNIVCWNLLPRKSI